MKVWKGKVAIITFGALCLTRPYLSVLATTPNNWKEGLMGQVPILAAPFRRKETTIKREKSEIEGGGAETPQHNRGIKKKRLLRPWRGPILSDESGTPQPDRKEYHDDRCSYAKT